MIGRTRTHRLARLALATLLPACSAAPERSTTVDGPDETGTQTSDAPSSSTADATATGTTPTTGGTTGLLDDDPCAACGPGTFCQWQGSDDVCHQSPFVPVACVPLPAGCDVGDLCELSCVHSVCPAYDCFVGVCDVPGALLCTSGECDPASPEPCAVEGTSCKLVAADDAPGPSASDPFKCVPTPEQPVGVGEACSMISDGTSKWSDCAAGSECFPSAAQPAGTCEQLCDGTADSACADPETACLIYQEGLGVCEARCDPLAGADACPFGQVCIFSAGAFACVLDASGDDGGLHAPCNYLNSCDPGLHCADATQVAGCDLALGDNCCTPWCDLDAAVCPEALECRPVFAMGEAPAGHEDVGECVTMP